jgi:RNA polymerase sigma-70 factor (ECF subfamily)
LDFDQIYKEHASLVFNVALSYVQNKEDAEEITQDVFVSVYNKLSDFEQKAKVSTWLYRITINKSLDYIKAKKRKKRFAFTTSLFSEKDGGSLHDPSNFDHPRVLMEQNVEMKKLYGWINELPEKQQTALILHKIEKKSQTEIAEIMDVSVKAVESMVQRAKSGLKKKMNEDKGL